MAAALRALPSAADTLTGVQRAAILVMYLERDVAKSLLARLSDDEVRQVGMAIAGVERVADETVENVVGEFVISLRSVSLMPLTGRDFASRVLPELVDEGRRGAVIGAIRRRVGADFPDFIRGRSPAAVAGVLVDEHPQVRAVALLRMGPENAAKVLALFDAETQTDITMRMARAERVSGELADDVENSIRRSLEDRDDPLTMDGASGAARILGRMPRERNVIVLEQVRERQGQLADEIQRLMIVFEDLNFLDDRAIQALLRVVERADLVAALKGADPATREKFLKNLSSRAATDLAEEIEMLSGVRRSAIRQAQQNVVTAAQKLHDTGVIVLLPGGGEDN